MGAIKGAANGRGIEWERKRPRLGGGGGRVPLGEMRRRDTYTGLASPDNVCFYPINVVSGHELAKHVGDAMFDDAESVADPAHRPRQTDLDVFIASLWWMPVERDLV
jgi:hypothetical protein